MSMPKNRIVIIDCFDLYIQMIIIVMKLCNPYPWHFKILKLSQYNHCESLHFSKCLIILYSLFVDTDFDVIIAYIFFPM